MGQANSDRQLASVRRLRHRHLLGRLDYLRALRQLSIGRTQSELARALGLTQPSISSALKSAARLADPRPGFSGAGPYEIAQRYAAGELDRERLLYELSRWGTHPVGRIGVGRAVDNRTDPEVDLRQAVRDGLLDEDTYQTVLLQRESLSRQRSI